MPGTVQPDIKNYRIDRELGRGGMATVYLANQLLLDRSVALKVMLPEFSQAVFQDAFLHEGKVIAQLEHPNIIRIYDIGIADNHLYMAMEYLAGGSLRDKLLRDKLSPDVVFDILQQVGSGLDFSHQQGFIHRDIKPANILFRQNGEAVLTDFGIAKLQNSTGEMTRIGMTAGTAHYMSPEQAATGELDNRTDLYSLGLVVFEMLSGEKVCQADSLVQAVHQHTVKPPPDLPAEYHLFQPVLHKALAKEPADRHRTIREFVEDFSVALSRYNESQAVTRVASLQTPEQHKTSPHPVARLQKEETPIWRRPVPVMILTAIAASAVAAAFLIPFGDTGQVVEPGHDRPPTQVIIPPPPEPDNRGGDQYLADNSDNSDLSLPPDKPGYQQPADEPVPSPEPVTPVEDNEEDNSTIPLPHQFPSRIIPGLAGKDFVVNSNSGLNLRSYPRQTKKGSSSNIIMNLNNRAQVRIISDKVFPETILGSEDVWVQVSYAGKSGYVYRRHIEAVTNPPPLTAGCRPHSGLTGKSFVIKKSGGTLFRKPFANSLLASIPSGQIAVAQENVLCRDNDRQGDWMEVRVQGQTGYIFDLDAFPLNKDNAERVVFAPGAISHTLKGQVGFRGTKRYSFGSLKDQRMYLEELGPSSVKIYAYGENNEILAFDDNALDAHLGSTQRYYVTFFGNSPGANKYHYKIVIVHEEPKL